MNAEVSVGSVITDLFDRGGLPERVAVMVANSRAGVVVGDVLFFSNERRAYVTPKGDFCVLASYVRLRWLQEFCWALPEQQPLFA